MRYDCNDFPGAFVEFSDAWTRKEFKRVFDNSDPAVYLALVRSKVVACYLPTSDGDAIDNPDKMTAERIEDVDVRLWTWFSNAVIKAVSDVAKLGEAVAASLWSGTETAKAADNPPTP